MKKIIFSFLSVILLLPSFSFAQWDVTTTPTGGLPSGTISGIILQVMYWLLGLLGIFGVIGFVISGILYLTAAGDDSKMELGKNAMKWSIMGVVVGLMGFVIIKAVNTMLGGSSASF